MLRNNGKHEDDLVRDTFLKPLTLRMLAFYTGSAFAFTGGSFLAAAITHHPVRALLASGGYLMVLGLGTIIRTAVSGVH